VVFTGITLSLGVITWVLSPIKFQADMGLLLTFMFLCNMVVALILVPALAYFLLAPKYRKQQVAEQRVMEKTGQSTVDEPLGKAEWQQKNKHEVTA